MSVLSASLVGTRRFISGLGQSGLLFTPVRRTLVEPGARVRGELRPLLLCHYGYELWSRGLIAGCCGNLSARMRDDSGIYITPRTVNKSRLLARDILRVPLDATPGQLADVSMALFGGLTSTLAQSVDLLGARSLLRAAAAAPMMVAVGVLGYSMLCALALRVLYKNLFVNRSLRDRYAHVSATS